LPKASRTARLRAVFAKTGGHCHFCGDKLVFEHYGRKRKPYPKGAWELDHVIQAAKGGADSPDNFLSACKECNLLRWHRRGKDLRRIILLGLVANDEIKNKSDTGREIQNKLRRRRAQNRRRTVSSRARSQKPRR